LVLRRGELHPDAAAANLVRLVVHLQVLEREVRRLLEISGATEDRADACDELLEAERLCQVVVSAERQAPHLVLRGVARGEEQDRNLVTATREPLRDLEAVEVREHDVEDQQVRTAIGDG